MSREFIYKAIKPRVDLYVDNINDLFGKPSKMKPWMDAIDSLIKFIEGDKKK